MDSHPPPQPKHSSPPQAIDAPARTAFAFDDIEDALDAFRRGEFLVVMDDEGRENEGDLIIAASEVSTEKMAWMIKHTRCALLHPPSFPQTHSFHQRVHLHCPPGRALGGAGHPHDGR